MRQPVLLILYASLWMLPSVAMADIFRWDNGQVIPGTEGITPGPEMQLSSAYDGKWNTASQNLRFADFSVDGG